MYFVLNVSPLCKNGYADKFNATKQITMHVFYADGQIDNLLMVLSCLKGNRFQYHKMQV